MALSAIDFNSLNLYEPNDPPKKELDKDAFLKLLIAQLRHQDPLDPMKDQEFIGQLAQLNALESNINLNKSLSAFIYAQTTTQAATFLGKDIVGMDAEGNEVVGTVTQVLIQDGVPLLMVGASAVKLDALIGIQGGTPPTGP